MLQVIAGERTIEEIRTITGIPGDGANNDMISVRIALELGCHIKPSKYQQYGSGIDERLLEVFGISRLKVHRLDLSGLDLIGRFSLFCSAMDPMESN